MMKLFLDLPRSDVRRRLDICRVKDFEYFLVRKRINFPTKVRARIVDHILLKPKLSEELIGVLYLREGITKKEITRLASNVGVMVKSSDTCEAIVLKVWLRKPDVLIRVHTLARADNIRKWCIWEKKEKARFERKHIRKLANALKSALRRTFRNDVRLVDLQKEGENTIVVLRHAGRGVFRQDVKKISYTLRSSEIILVWDFKKLKVSSSSLGTTKVVDAFSKVLGADSGFIPEDVDKIVRGWLTQAQKSAKFSNGQIIRVKGKSQIRGVQSYDIRGKNLEKIIHMLGHKINISKSK